MRSGYITANYSLVSGGPIALLFQPVAHCGYKSRTVLYRLLQRGMLSAYETGQRGRSLLLETNPAGPCSLKEHVGSCLQLRHDSPLAQRPIRGAEAEICDEALELAMAPIHRLREARDHAARWEEVAERLNSYLDPSWPAPPWTADQVATLALCLDMAADTLSY